MPDVSADGSEEWIELGRIVGVFGVRGEVRLHLHHRDSSLWKKPVEVRLVQDGRPDRTDMVTVRPGAGKRIIGRLKTLTSPDDARAAMGTKLMIPRTTLPPLKEDEFYFDDLVNAEVWVGDERVGRVRMVHAAGPMEILEIRAGGEIHLVPCAKEFVVSMEPAKGKVVLTEDALVEE